MYALKWGRKATERTSLADEWIVVVAHDIVETDDSRARSSSSKQNTFFDLTHIISPSSRLLVHVLISKVSGTR